MSTKFHVLVETSIVNISGRTRTFDEILDETNNQETVLRYTNKGSFAQSELSHVEPEMDCENIKVYTVTLFSGEHFSLVEGSQILASDNTWVSISEKKVGDGLKTLTYNPSVRHPQLIPKVIASIVVEVLPFAPLVHFSLNNEDNLLIAAVSDKEPKLLVPVRPAVV
jgi:hypothetical protein